MLNSLVSDHQAGEPAVANMSLGGEASSALDSAVQAVINDGVTVVVASGNDGEYSCNYSPARVAAAITVNSSDRYDDDSSFSNYGACSDIYAPGESIISAWITSNSAVEYLSGTSMASPFVAGVAARILQRNPRFTPSQVWSAISNTATTVSFLPSAGDPDKLLFASSNSITWNANGGTSVEPGPSVYEAGGSIGSLPLTTTKAGHTFAGWWVDPTFSTGSAITSQYTPGFPYGPVTLYAKWSASNNITWNVNGGALVSPGPSVYEAGGSIGSLPLTAAKVGYTFAGWWIDPTFSTGSAITSQYTPGFPYGPVTLYAKWSANTYTVTYNYNSATGGNGAVYASFTTDGPFISLPTPTRTGYTFSG
jgi:uncharacterized repeat protein (TIGR02543 family)